MTRLESTTLTNPRGEFLGYEIFILFLSFAKRDSNLFSCFLIIRMIVMYTLYTIQYTITYTYVLQSSHSRFSGRKLSSKPKACTKSM